MEILRIKKTPPPLSCRGSKSVRVLVIKDAKINIVRGEIFTDTSVFFFMSTLPYPLTQINNLFDISSSDRVEDSQARGRQIKYKKRLRDPLINISEPPLRHDMRRSTKQFSSIYMYIKKEKEIIWILVFFFLPLVPSKFLNHTITRHFVDHLYNSTTNLQT